MSAAASSGATFEQLDDGSFIVSGKKAKTDTYTLSGSTSLEAITAVRVDVLSDERLGQKGPGRAGNFVLNEFELAANVTSKSSAPPKCRDALSIHPVSRCLKLRSPWRPYSTRWRWGGTKAISVPLSGGAAGLSNGRGDDRSSLLARRRHRDRFVDSRSDDRSVGRARLRRDR